MNYLISVLLLLAVGCAAAQTAVRPPAASQTWHAAKGQARALSVGIDGAVFAIDPQGAVWLRRPGMTSSWSLIPGDFRRIAAFSQNSAWAIDAQGSPYQYSGSWWRPMGEHFPVELEDIAVSSEQQVYAVARTGDLLRLDGRRGVQSVAGAPVGLRRVSLDASGQPWVIDRDYVLHRFDGNRWRLLEGFRIMEVAAGNGGIWAIDNDGQLLMLDATTGLPSRVAAEASVVASAPGGFPWIATLDGHIYASNLDTRIQREATRQNRVQVFSELLNWQPVNGNARQIVISASGAVLALGREGEAWQWKARHQWGRLPGTFIRLALDQDNTPWGIVADGRILRYQGSYWSEMPGRASDIVGGADGSLWVVQDDGQPARWSARERLWQALPAAERLRRLAVGPDGGPWAIGASGGVLHLVGTNWEALPEVEAQEIAIGPGGSVMVIDADKRLLRWDAAGKDWERLNGSAETVAVGPHDRPWITTPEARILASAFFDERPDSQVNTTSLAAANAAADAAGGVSVGPQVVGQPGNAGGAPRGNPREPLEYRKVDGKARDIAIGADGSVFIVTSEGKLARWSNMRNVFIAFPGQLARVAVAADGKPWGVTAVGEVFRHDGNAWQVVRNIQAQDIAIGFDGTVIVADAQSFLQRYDPGRDAFVRLQTDTDGVPPMGRRVAVTPAGTPWVIDTEGFVGRCEKVACERLPVKARSLDIGPEGSVLIVDTNRILRRWSAREESFERIDGIAEPIDFVAVGPRGKPWLLSAASEVWASEFFPRDERGDVLAVAITEARISDGSAGSVAPPVFSFPVSMAFEKLLVLNQPFEVVPEIATLQMAINPLSGQVTIIDAGNRFFNYNEASRSLQRDANISVPPIHGEQVRSFVIARDGSYWLTVGQDWNAEVLRYQVGQWTEVPGNWTAGFAWMPMTLAEAPDGTVYVNGPDQQLYRYEVEARRFVRVTMALPNGQIHALAVAPDGHFWVASEGAVPGLYEQVGGGWTLRRPESGFLDDCKMGGFTCFALGPKGEAYLVDVYGPQGALQLQRWNTASRSWDIIRASPELGDRGVYAIAPDGRPWIIARASLGGAALYRAR